MADTATLMAPPSSQPRPMIRRGRPSVTWLATAGIAAPRPAIRGSIPTRSRWTPRPRRCRPAALVTLRRADERPLGVAMFNPHTLIAARLLDRDAGAADRHAASLSRRLERALRLRERLYRRALLPAGPCRGRRPARASSSTASATVLVVQTNTAGMDRLSRWSLEALRRAADARGDRAAQRQPGARARRPAARDRRGARARSRARSPLDENGAVFRADLLGRAEDRLVLRPARQPRALSPGWRGGARVLDLYCYQRRLCGAGGARAAPPSVLGIDRSEPALALAAARGASSTASPRRCSFRRGRGLCRSRARSPRPASASTSSIADPPAFAQIDARTCRRRCAATASWRGSPPR